MAPPDAALRDRARGLLVGLALGDALGAPVARESEERITGRRDELFSLPGGGPSDWAPGEFTDHTQAALIVARHLCAQGGALHEGMLAEELARWVSGAREVDEQTGAVLQAVREGESWRTSRVRVSAEAFGSAPLVRTAPVGIAAPSRGTAMSHARRQCEVTHLDEMCVDASGVMASVFWDAVDGYCTPVHVLADRAQTYEVRDAVADAIQRGRPIVTGSAVGALTAALWAVNGARDFGDAIWRGVSLGYDATAVGALTGGLMGARVGLRQIPESLSERLESEHPELGGPYPDQLIALADQLVDLRGSRHNS